MYMLIEEKTRINSTGAQMPRSLQAAELKAEHNSVLLWRAAISSAAWESFIKKAETNCWQI
jgi:hypothetical protein